MGGTRKYSMEIISQKQWVELVETVMDPTLDKYGFRWQYKPAPGYGLDDWNTKSPAVTWACAARSPIYVMFLLDKVEHDTISVEVEWGPSWCDRLQTEKIVFFHEKRFVEECGFAVNEGEYPQSELTRRFIGYTRQLLVHRLILERYGQELLEGNYQKFVGYPEKAIGEMKERIQHLGNRWADMQSFWDRLR